MILKAVWQLNLAFEMTFLLVSGVGFLIEGKVMVGSISSGLKSFLDQKIRFFDKNVHMDKKIRVFD